MYRENLELNGDRKGVPERLRRLILAVLLGTAMATLLPKVWADIVLDPDPIGTIEGNVCLSNEIFANGNITSYGTSGLSYNVSFASDAQRERC